MNPYEFELHHRTHQDDELYERIDIYRFKTRLNRVYLVEVECFKKNLYFVKFYLRSHKNLGKKKYRVVLNDHDASRILDTCLAITKKIAESDELASFGFFGMNSENETLTRTIRYRIYSQMAITFFSESLYHHSKDDNNSLYILINKRQESLDPEEIVEKIETHFDFTSNS